MADPACPDGWVLAYRGLPLTDEFRRAQNPDGTAVLTHGRDLLTGPNTAVLRDGLPPDALVTAPPYPYSTDSEHDRRVRAVLTGLAASADIPVGELLQQIGAAAHALKQLVPTGPAAGEPSGAPGPGPVTVLRSGPVTTSEASKAWSPSSRPLRHGRAAAGRSVPGAATLPPGSSRRRSSNTPRPATGSPVRSAGSAVTPAPRPDRCCARAGCWPAPTATTRPGR